MAAEAMATRLGHAPALPGLPVNQPLLVDSGFDRHNNRQFRARYATDMWMLDEHRTLEGRAIVPGTGVIEIATQALRAQGEKGAFEIRDLMFLRALEVDGPRNIQATLIRSEEGYGFELRSEASLAGRQGFVLNAQARLIPGLQPRPAALDLNALAERCTTGIRQSDAGLRSPQEAHLAFGPRWRVLRRTALGQGEGLAHLALPAAFRGDLDEGYVLHPALMDLATGWAMALIDGYEARALWVPVAYARLRVYAPLPAAIVSWVRIRPSEPGFARFDVTLTTPEGEICADIEGFTIKRLEGGFGAEPPLLAAEMIFTDEPDATRALTLAESRLARNLAQGITPTEGAEAFLRSRALALPQVYISSLTLPELIAEADERDTEPSDSQKFERPDLNNTYVAPSTDIERILVGFWEELLGVKGVGVEDSFFDLGGHSLIAVRLFAKVKKTWSVDFPISVLFEAPTVAKCAAMIREHTGPEDGSSSPASAGGSTPARRFEFLVPMHEGEGGPRTPFFLVAGMFGNVLNLRHLAGLVGTDRPFYGLQARGLLGDKPPHETLAQAARDYLAEIRQIQPEGPYLLGGFSGGGLSALEMAWALEAAGERAALLVLLDSPVPQRPALSRKDKVLIKLSELRSKGPGYLAEWWQARRAWTEAQRLRAAMPPQSDTHAFHNQAIEEAFRQALPQMRLRSYGGRTALFRPPLDRHWRVSGGRWVSAEKEYVTPDNDWSRWMPDLSVHEVPGDHDSMVLEPNVRVLATELRALFREVEA